MAVEGAKEQGGMGIGVERHEPGIAPVEHEPGLGGGRGCPVLDHRADGAVALHADPPLGCDSDARPGRRAVKALSAKRRAVLDRGAVGDALLQQRGEMGEGACRAFLAVEGLGQALGAEQ